MKNLYRIAIIAAAGLVGTTAAQLQTQDPTHRLVGIGCGPERLTFTAAEENHFPQCTVIGTPDEFGCAENDTPEQCAAYLGDGY